MDGGNVDLALSDDPFDCVRLHVDSIPILVTICKIGEHCVVDPSAEEEVCSSASLVVGVSVREENGKFHQFYGCTCIRFEYYIKNCLHCMAFSQLISPIFERAASDHFTWIR